MKSGRPRVVVVGSLVADFVFHAGHRPKPGETVVGESFDFFLGGKGFNQAVGCRRLGADVGVVGRVGQDWLGDRFLEGLAREGMPADHVVRDPEAGTGVAAPVVFADGENSIIAVPRANAALTPGDVDRAEQEIARADVLMLQCEVNADASQHAAELARRHSTLVVLDPAPVHAECDACDWEIDYLVPNEVEANALAEGNGPEEWARELFDEDCRAVVVSLGPRGALAIDSAGVREHAGYRVPVVDTTGAGDAFRAGLAVMLAREHTLDEAVAFANACGALACTISGTGVSMPVVGAVEGFMAHNRPTASEGPF